MAGLLDTSDPNPGDSFTYEFATGEGDTDNAAFAFTGPTTLVSAQMFDYETKAAYSIRVRVTDSGGMTYEESIDRGDRQ